MLACSMPDLVAQVTSSLLQFPDVSVQALGEDEIRLDLVLRGKFAQGQNGWAWLACGPQLEVVNSVTGERLSAYRFSGIEQPPTVLAVKEFCWLKRTGLLVGLEETEGSVLCLYDLGLSRVVKAVVLPGRVTAIEPIINHGGANASTQHLHQSLRWFFGVAAVVTDLGHVFLIDICLDDLSCSQSELEASDLEIINRFPADVPQIRETVTRDGRHLCYQLHSATGTSATTLHYISRTNQLAVGFADGYLSLWNLKTLKKEYHCQLEGGRVPIYAVIFQEPENDPRSCCYLWAVQSAQDFEADVLSLHLLQLAFGDRKCISSGQILYEGLEYCEERYSQDLSRGIVSFRGQASNIKLLGCQTIEKFRGHSDREESMNEAMSPDTSIAVFSWQVNPYGQGKPSSYLGVFDINRWYHAQMPDSLRPGEFLHNCPYFSLWSLDSVVGMISPYYLLDILVHEKSLSRGVPPSYPPPEQFFSPSSYNFDATCLLNFGIVHLTCSGFQKETLQFLKKSGTCLDDAIPNGYNRCLVAGLLSPRLTDIQPSCLTEEEQLEALMTAAVETSSLGLLSGCIRQWSAEGAAAHLRFVLEWAWKKVVGTKEELDRICTPLFDGSCNFIDIQTFQSLQRCQLLLCNLSTIFSCFLTEAHDVTEKGLVELTNKCVVTTLLSQYAQVVLWFCRSGLLPDGSDEDEVLQLSRPFYNYQLIQSYYTSRRQKLERLSRGKWCGDCLMVDGMISQFGERIEKLWRRDDGGTGRYPPSTLHALLDIYLQENVQEMQKHAVIIYLLLDVMYSFPNKNKSSIEAFPTAFAIPLGLVKLIQGFWLLDHGDHENSLDLILHPATSRLLSSMEHKRIIHALMCQGEHKQALRYVQTMKPLMNTISEVKLYLSVLLLNRCMVEARDLVRQHASRLNMEDLLKHMYETCQEMSLMEDLLKLPFTAAEQDCLERFLYNSGGMQSHEFLLVHHLQRANYVPALQLNQSLNMNLMNDRVPRMRERATARNSILDQYGRVLPRVQRRLATERVKPYYHPSTVLREVSRPVPLSTVAKPVVSGKILTKATFINNLLSKIGEVWPRSQRNVNLSPYNSSDIEDESPSASPVELPDAFVGTPVTTSFKRMSSRLFESVVCPVPLSPPIDSIQQMQSKTSPVWMTFSPARRSSAVSSQLKRISKASELSLLKTPPVVKKAKALASTTSGFSGFAPQSILRSSLRPSPLASPSASPGRSVTPPLRIKETRISFMEENIASTWNRNTADKESNLLPRSLSTSPWAARLEKVISFDLHKRFETEVPERTSSNEKYIAAEADISKEISSTSVRSEQSTLEYHDAQAPDDFYEESATLNSRPVENVNAEPIKNGEHEIFRSTALECFELVASTGKHSEPKSVARPAGLNGLSETAEEEPTDSMNEENVQCIDRLDRINSADTELVNGPAETAKNTFAEVPEHEIIEQITQPVPDQVFDHRHLETVNNESTTIGGSEHSAGAAETVCSSIEHREEPAIEMSHNQQLDSSNRETSVEHEELNETESCAFPENGISSFAFSHPMHEAFTSQYTTREIENLTSNYETEGALLVSDECNTLIKITESASAVSENESVTVHDNEGVFASTYIENSLESGSAFLKTYDIEAKVVEENECQQDEHFIILPVKALEIHMVEDGELEEQTTEDSGEVSYVECHPPQPFQVSCTLDAEFMSNKINDNDMSTTEAAKCVSMNGNHDGPEENFTLILEGEDECSDTETTSTFHITTTVEVVDQEYEDQTSLQKSPTLVLVQEPNNADAPTYVPESVKEAVAESLSDAVKDTRNKDFVEMVETLDEEKTETDKALGRYLYQSLQPVVQDVKDPEVNDQVEVKETSNESDRGRSVLTKDETSFEILQSESEQNEQEVATLYPGSVEKLKEHFEIPETMHPDLTEGQIAGVSPAERLLPSPRRSTRKVQERLRSLEGVHPVSGEGSIAPVCPVVRSSPSPRRSTRKIQQRYGNNEMHPESGEEQIAQASPAVKFSQSPRNSTRRVQQRFESPEIVHPESGKEQIAGVSPALRSSTPSSSNQKAEQRFESPEVENLESEEEHITGVPLALRFSLSPTMSTKKAEQRFESPETEHPYSGEGQVDGVSTTLSSQSPKRSAKKEQTFESHEEELPVSGEDQIDGVSVALRSSQSPGRSTEKAEQRFESPETEHADAGEGQTAGVFPVLRALQSPRMSTEKEPRFGSPEAVFPLPGGQTAKVSPTLRSSTSPRKSTRKVQQRFESPKAMHPDSAEEKIAEVSPALRSSPSPRRSTKKVEERFGSQKAVHSNLGDEQSSEESPNLTASPSLERSAGKLGARLPSPEAIQPESNERLIAQLFPTLRASASPRRSARRVRETFDTPEAVRPESPEGQSAQVSALRRSTRKKNTNVEMSGKAHPLADKRAQTPASVGRVTRSKKDAPLAIPEIWQTEVEDKHFKKTDQSLVSSSGVLKVTKGSSDVLQADLLSPKMTEISASPVRSSRKAKGITFSLPENVIDTQEKKTEQTSPKSFTKRAGRSRVLQSKEVTVPVSAETFDQLEHALLPFTPVSARKGTSYLQENIKNIGNVQDTIPLQEKLPVSLRRSARKATTSELKHTEASSALGKISVEPSTESILSKSAGKTAQTTKYHSVKEQLPAVEDISDEVFLQSESIDKNRLGGTNTNAPVIASRIEESISVKTTRATRSRAARDLSPEAAVKESDAPVFTRIARNSRVIEEPEHPVSSDVPQSLVSPKSVSSTPATRSKKKTKSVEEMGLPVIEDEVPKVTDIDETQTRAKSKAVKAAVKKRKRLKGGLWSPPPVEVNLISPLPSPLEEYMSNRKGADEATTKMILRTNRKRLMSAFPKPVTRRKML